MKTIVILGDGQVWDLQGIDPRHPKKIFEDLFCGRALEERAKLDPGIFSQYIEKGKNKITGISVTKALLDGKNKKAQKAALGLLNGMAGSAGRGIEVLTRAEGWKPGWDRKEIALWKDLTGVIVGAGVSKGKTGDVLIKGIKNYLQERGLGGLEIFKAKFPGKESGFLGAVVNILDLICSEERARKAPKIGAIGIDLGRDKIGAGILMVNPETCDIIKGKPAQWVYRHSIKTARSNSRFKQFNQHRKLGEELRGRIVEQIAGLIILATAKAKKLKFSYSRHIGLALPGQTTPEGYLVGSTDYLPFFTKNDGFHFSRAIEDNLARKGFSDFHLHLINDGIAAGLANLRLGIGLEHLKIGKYAFLGPGSGLGGCLCRIEEVK